MRETLAAATEHSLEVKRSRFLARAAALAEADSAAQFLHQTRLPEASHNCWAWRFGDQYRSSDDGEPAGTAGRPILAAIDGQGLDRVVVQVARWFGGIKLGAGGLVRAYGGAAAACLRAAPKLPLRLLTEVRLHCPFDCLGSVQQALLQATAETIEERFDGEGVWLRLQVPEEGLLALAQQLKDLSRGRIGLQRD